MSGSSFAEAARLDAAADRRRNRLWTIGMCAGFALLVLGMAGVVLVRWPSGPAKRACDREVGALLTSHDLVEVQRAGILVRELNCDVVHRLAQVP